MRNRGDLEPSEGVVQPYLDYDLNLERFLDLVSQADGICLLEQQTSLNGSVKPEIIWTSLHGDVCGRAEALHSA